MEYTNQEGKVSKFLRRGYKMVSKRGGVTRTLYQRTGQPLLKKEPKDNRMFLAILKKRIALARLQQARNKQRVLTPQQQAYKNQYDYIFSNFSNPRFNVAGQVNREVMNHSGASYSNSINQISQEVNLSSNANLGSQVNPFKKISIETDYFSNIVP